MSITVEEVKKLAALSRIRLSPEEEISMQAEIGSILGYIEEINKVDLGTDEHIALERLNIMREDKNPNETGLCTEKLLASAPGREGNYVKVKKIM